MLEKAKAMALWHGQDTFGDIDPKAIEEVYNKSDPVVYEYMMSHVAKSTDPERLAELIADEMFNLPSDSLIYEIGCGSGFFGLQLAAKGFTNIVGSDGAGKWMEAAREKGVYKELHHFFNGMGVDKFPDHMKNRFDIVTSANTFVPGVIPCGGFDDAYVALKVGGHFVTSYRKFLDTPGDVAGYRDTLDRLEQAGKWKRVYESTHMRGNNNSGVDLWTEMEFNLVAYQKTA